MSHYYADIKAGIVSALSQATKAKNIYDYENTKPAGYPAITVTPVDGEAEFLDTQRVRRDFIFSVKLYQERLEVGPSEAERIMTNLVDQAVSVFDNFSNTTLGNTVIFMKPVKVKWGYLAAPDADVRSCEITLIGEVAQ
jgi:hypothetical protein